MKTVSVSVLDDPNWDPFLYIHKDEFADEFVSFLCLMLKWNAQLDKRTRIESRLIEVHAKSIKNKLHNNPSMELQTEVFLNYFFIKSTYKSSSETCLPIQYFPEDLDTNLEDILSLKYLKGYSPEDFVQEDKVCD